MENKIITRRRELSEELRTVNFRIRNHKQYFSRDQVRCWYVRRRKIKELLRMLPTEEQVKADARAATALKKSILKPIPKRYEIRTLPGLWANV